MEETIKAAVSGRRGLSDLEWVEIPAGSFPMGSEEGDQNERPVHEVTLSAYGISKYPVTNAQYAAFVTATGARPPRHWEGGRIPEGKENHPVVHVSWDDAQACCEWLDRQPGQERGKVTLPTEAQWEYAARGSAGRPYPWGDAEPDAERCNFGRNVGDTSPVDAYPKGSRPEGVYDLAGNVWEWVQDAWHDNYEGAPADGSAWEFEKAGASRVLRSGSWNGHAELCRSVYRDQGGPDGRDYDIGFRFRCARVQGREPGKQEQGAERAPLARPGP